MLSTKFPAVNAGADNYGVQAEPVRTITIVVWKTDLSSIFCVHAEGRSFTRPARIPGFEGFCPGPVIIARYAPWARRRETGADCRPGFRATSPGSPRRPTASCRRL